MSLLALSIERPLPSYNYPVPDNPLVLPKRTTTSKPEEGGSKRLAVPKNPEEKNKKTSQEENLDCKDDSDVSKCQKAQNRPDEG